LSSDWGFEIMGRVSFLWSSVRLISSSGSSSFCIFRRVFPFPFFVAGFEESSKI
jgi:hypothetical protein